MDAETRICGSCGGTVKLGESHWCERPSPPPPPMDAENRTALASIGITPNTEYHDESPWLTCTEPNGEEPADSLADALDTMQRAAMNDARRETLERVRDTLKAHYLIEVKCHHEAKTDTAHCYCTIWCSEALPSVGAAVDAWVAHVMEVLNGAA